MEHKLTRRGLAASLISAGAAIGQTARTADSPEKLLAEAKKSVRRKSDVLSRFKLDIAVEPAATFKA